MEYVLPVALLTVSHAHLPPPALNVPQGTRLILKVSVFLAYQTVESALEVLRLSVSNAVPVST